jgi:hypothetical protein
MKNRLSVARCCCDCANCCNGDYPSEYDVDITLTDDLCTECSGLDGTFTLTRVTTGAGCTWRYDSGYGLSEDCDPPAGQVVVNKIVQLSILCSSTTQYTLTLTIDIRREVTDCPGQYDIDTYTWGKTVNVADYNCSTASVYALPYTSKFSVRKTYNVFLSRCVDSFGVNYYCDPSADATITAVP